jgi:hypothetical protein
MTATTIRMWMNPFTVKDVSRPRAQSTINMNAIVININYIINY